MDPQRPDEQRTGANQSDQPRGGVTPGPRERLTEQDRAKGAVKNHHRHVEPAYGPEMGAAEQLGPRYGGQKGKEALGETVARDQQSDRPTGCKQSQRRHGNTETE